MATANDVINEAASRLGILAGGEALDATDAAACLTMMNDMMHALRTRGVKYAHVTLAASDTVNVPDQLIDALKWLQADAICDDFGVQLTARQESQIADALNVFRAFYYQKPVAPSDRALLRQIPGTFNLQRGS